MTQQHLHSGATVEGARQRSHRVCRKKEKTKPLRLCSQWRGRFESLPELYWETLPGRFLPTFFTITTETKCSPLREKGPTFSTTGWRSRSILTSQLKYNIKGPSLLMSSKVYSDWGCSMPCSNRLACEVLPGVEHTSLPWPLKQWTGWLWMNPNCRINPRRMLISEG